MTPYVIEAGVPIPPPHIKASCQDRRGPQTDWTRLLDALGPGQSVLTPDYSEYRTAESFRLRKTDRQFAIRKIPGHGWRVWRTA
jgi:hypothetical protein